MSQDAQFTHAHMVRFERNVPVQPGELWRVLTEVEALPGWYGDGKIEAAAGGAVELMAGHIRGTVTHCTPEQRLAYSWNVFNPGDEVSPYPESYLTLELEPRGGGTCLFLTHLPVLEQFVKLNAMGWHTFLDMVEAAATGRKVEPRAVYMQRNAQRYGIDLAKMAS
jgi:uncharacterized protein YndB with AHSA1/START domain